MKSKPLPPRDLVAERLVYDTTSPSGLRWRVSPARRVRPGDVAGWRGSNGYWHVSIEARKFRVHRVIWLLMHGEDPGDLVVDHINGDSQDNRVENLRQATHAQNLRNHRPYLRRSGRCSSQFRGVCLNRRAGRWMAYINCDGHRDYLGLFATEEAAARAYDAAARELHGEFARLNFNP